MPAFKDLTGETFEKLFVVRRAANIWGRVAWECQCECGNVVCVTGNALQSRNTKSCGCLNHIKTLVDIDWNNPESRNVRRRELYAAKRAAGHKRIRLYTPEEKNRRYEREKERRKEDPEKAREQDRQKKKRYYDTHPEQVAALNKKFRENNPSYGVEWYASHKDERRVYNALFHIAHPEIKRESTKKRRARLLQAPRNDFTERQWQEMKAAYGHRCVYCGRKMQRLTQDHITPLSKGGSHTASNIVPACQSCNSKKYTNGPLKPIQPLLILLAPSQPPRKTGNI